MREGDSFKVPSLGLAVDGASLFHMVKIIGTPGVRGVVATNFMGLISVAKKIGNNLPFAEAPRCTIRPDLCREHGGLYKDMKRAGIEPRAVSCESEQDDARVKLWLHRYVNWEHVTDVILVTTDGDIIRELIWLAEYRLQKMKSPLRIDILGTLRPDRDGHCPLSKRLVAELNKLPDCHFHEIMEFRQLVVSRRW